MAAFYGLGKKGTKIGQFSAGRTLDRTGGVCSDFMLLDYSIYYDVVNMVENPSIE